MAHSILTNIANSWADIRAFSHHPIPSSLQSGEGTPQVTGWFEVTVAGKLVHSKKNGDGFVDNDTKLRKIVMAVTAALA